MTRINDLPKEIRLTLIEEARWQFGDAHIQECIDNNAEINGICAWAKTLQGAEYWARISNSCPKG